MSDLKPPRSTCLKDLTGKVFNKWTVLERANGHWRKGTKWKCSCECGVIRDVSAANLTRGFSQSCGNCEGVRSRRDYVSFFQEKIKNNICKTDTGCWVWIGNNSPSFGKYGRLKISGRAIAVHILSYKLFVSPIPSGMLVCHKCDNPPCCNPDHLFLGSNKDNISDMVAKNRQAKGERIATSKLNAEQVLEIRRLWLTGELNQQQIGARFGVTGGNVSLIVKRKAWIHLN